MIFTAVINSWNTVENIKVNAKVTFKDNFSSIYNYQTLATSEAPWLFWEKDIRLFWEINEW